MLCLIVHEEKASIDRQRFVAPFIEALFCFLDCLEQDQRAADPCFRSVCICPAATEPVHQRDIQSIRRGIADNGVKIDVEIVL